MKKALLILLVTIVLAACGNDNSDSSEPSEVPANEPSQSEEAGTDEEDQSEGTEEDQLEDTDEDTSEDIDEDTSEGIDEDTSEDIDESSGTDNSAIEDFDEYNIVAEHIDLDEYTGIVKTDNKGNRVILYEDADGEKEYKSVFVKNDNRLKVISFDDDEKPLYNDRIN